MSNQLYELTRFVSERLVAKKYPFRTHYGPERFDRSGAAGESVVLFMHDRTPGGRDAIEGAKGTGPRTVLNGTQAPKKATRKIAAMCRIYAQATLRGAMIQDHEELADYLSDAVIAALEDWAKEGQAGAIEYVESGYMTPEELVTANGAPEQFPGAVYQIRFRIGRGVYDRDYTKAGRPIGLITGTSNEARVRLNSSDPPEVVPF